MSRDLEKPKEAMSAFYQSRRTARSRRRSTAPCSSSTASTPPASSSDGRAVPNPGDYIQVRATVPTFDTSNPNEWVANGEQPHRPGGATHWKLPAASVDPGPR